MPYNLKQAVVVPGTVFPQSLSTSFVQTLVYPLLAVNYNDGSFERSLVRDGQNAPRALRTWSMSKRLSSAQLTALYNFWTNNVLGGLYPFYFYDPFGVLPGQHIGSNYDASGNSTQGRVVVFLRGDWGQRTEMGRHTVPNVTLVEVA